MKKLTLILLFLYSPLLTSILITCAAVDTIPLNQTIKDGTTIVSSSETFKLGFFSPGNSKNRYVGIWYNKISTCTVVWVANRETPLTDTSGELRLSQGGLQLLNSNNTVVWSTNSSGSVGLVAQLLDTGNLVLQDQGFPIWQSFDYPGDTLLPGMRIGVDLITGKENYLTSWKRDDDPSAGSYALRVEPNGYPQLFETKDSSSFSRFGPWNGVMLSGMPNLGANSTQFVFSGKERYYEYKLMNDSLVSRMHLKPDGSIEYWNLNSRTRSWNMISTATNDNCSPYSICGPYGVCNVNNAPACKCLDGFEPQRPDEWNLADWLSGCQRIEPLACGNGDSFHSIVGVKFPDTNRSWYNQSMTLGECEAACRRNCSCIAYASSDISNGGSGCLHWFDDLMDIRTDDETQLLYIRMPASELTTRKHDSNSKKQRIIIVVPTLFGSILVCLLILAAWRKKKSSKKKILGRMPARDEICTNESGKEDTEFSSYNLTVIIKSTNNFSPDNKLGEGGFGPDKDMNPKISDFGLARRFSGHETEANTNRVVGTYGYIPPEYALHGLFSVKSDVYSFGVLVLEIVSGKKNRGFSQDEHNHTLIGHAWRLFQEGKALELMNSSFGETCIESQVLRSIHIGLLCVQHHAEDRPTMSSVVLMLGNENTLPPPKQPAFFAEEEMPDLKSISSAPTLDSVDDITITLLQAR